MLVVVPVGPALCELVTLLAMPFCCLTPTVILVGKSELAAGAHTLSRSAEVHPGRLSRYQGNMAAGGESVRGHAPWPR
jgi:hypothetical protein